MQEMQARALGHEDPLEKEMATHASTLAWRIQWTEEPGGPPSLGLQRVGHDFATKPPPPPSPWDKEAGGCLQVCPRQLEQCRAPRMWGINSHRIKEAAHRIKQKALFLTYFTYRVISHTWNLNYGTNEPTFKTETESQTWTADLRLSRGEGGRGENGHLGLGDASYYEQDG